MILTPQYGYRSGCCFAPIKLGRKKIKNTNLKVDIWVCCKCSKRDVPLVKYTAGEPPKTTILKPNFAKNDSLRE